MSTKRPLKPELPVTQSSTAWARLWHSVLRMLGWTLRGVRPVAPKYMICLAPHTSNWDWLLFVLASRALDLPAPRFVAKHSIFRGPLGPIMRGLGGIPVDRTRSQNFVDQVVAAYAAADVMVIGITPEGTRKRTEYWRSGFYSIAIEAGIPIAMGYIDYPRREIGLTPPFAPSGNIDADFVRIRAFFAGVQGRFPDQQCEAYLRPASAQIREKVVADVEAGHPTSTFPAATPPPEGPSSA